MIERVVILVPVFNDWRALGMLLPRLDQVLRNEGVEARVLVVDDASSTQNYEDFVPTNLKAIKKVDVLELRRNLGHQRGNRCGAGLRRGERGSCFTGRL